jgi:hypothetical protein
MEVNEFKQVKSALIFAFVSALMADRRAQV